jgi:16S rRNA (guanine(966)-N(2))-methyltransferase RsmD
MMRILSGEARGRRLQTPKPTPTVRPILARIKKSLFDIIRPRLKGSRFLDLYAGTGAVGLEALSEGAASASFVEKDPMCIRLLEANIASFGYKEKSRVNRRDVVRDLSFLPPPFDIIFMGPPYVNEQKNPLALTTPSLAAVFKANLLAEKGVIVAQHHKKEEVALPSETWEIFRTERYGDTVLDFVRTR